MKILNSIISIIILLFTLLSCASDDYEFINNFAKDNNVEVFNLQEETFCFKDLYLTNEEQKKLNIKINEDRCNSKKMIEINKIKFNKSNDKKLETKISFPLYSNDKKFVFIVIQTYKVNNANFYKKEILYKLSRIKKKWIIVDTYETITQS